MSRTRPTLACPMSRTRSHPFVDGPGISDVGMTSTWRAYALAGGGPIGEVPERIDDLFVSPAALPENGPSTDIDVASISRA